MNPIDIIDLSDAQALAATLPDVFDADGAKRQAQAIEIVRDGSGWRIQIPRVATSTLPSGRKVREGLANYSFPATRIADQCVTMAHPDGRQFRVPLCLAQAILGALYVGLERGEIATEPNPAPEAPAQEPAP